MPNDNTLRPRTVSVRLDGESFDRLPPRAPWAVGRANFPRLRAQLGDACHFWLMPGWADSLQRYGSHALWLRTLDPFLRVRPDLPGHLAPLLTQMELNGLALEQEVVWLTA